MENRNSVWSVTINNPTADDVENISRAKQKGWIVEGQEERGVEGTAHYQLMVKTGQQRFSALKKAFPRAHIEPARNASALEQYVHKSETKVAELPSSQMYPSQSRYWTLVVKKILTSYLTVSEYRFGSNGRLCNSQYALIRATNDLIREGYFVETMAVNPQTLSAWKWFHDSIIFRSCNELMLPYPVADRQTTDTLRVVIPTISSPEVDITHASSFRQDLFSPHSSDSQGTEAPRFQSDDSSSQG